MNIVKIITLTILLLGISNVFADRTARLEKRVVNCEFINGDFDRICAECDKGAVHKGPCQYTIWCEHANGETFTCPSEDDE